jgi:hypothetical protein
MKPYLRIQIEEYRLIFLHGITHTAARLSYLLIQIKDDRWVFSIGHNPYSGTIVMVTWNHTYSFKLKMIDGYSP